jgi:hypothetical protein
VYRDRFLDRERGKLRGRVTAQQATRRRAVDAQRGLRAGVQGDGLREADRFAALLFFAVIAAERGEPDARQAGLPGKTVLPRLCRAVVRGRRNADCRGEVVQPGVGRVEVFQAS